MVLLILLGVLFVLFFLCNSNLVLFSMPIELETHKFLNLEHKQSRNTPPYRLRFVTQIQGVTKAIGTVFGGRPSGRKVTEPAAIALMISRVKLGFARTIRPRCPHQTSSRCFRNSSSRCLNYLMRGAYLRLFLLFCPASFAGDLLKDVIPLSFLSCPLFSFRLSP